MAEPPAMHNASAERVSNAFFIIQSLKTNMSACGAELLLLESVRPIESSNFRTIVPNKRFKSLLMNGWRVIYARKRAQGNARTDLVR
jgi:hypothetical protein